MTPEEQARTNLEKFKLIGITQLSEKFLEEAQIDYSFIESFTRDLVTLRVKQEVWGQRIGEQITVKFPADWKEAIKERFAPAWFLKRWPVEYNETVINLAELYPKWRPDDTERVIVNMSDNVDPSRTTGISYTDKVQ